MGGVITEQIAARLAWDAINTMYDDEFQDHVAGLIKTLKLPNEIGTGAPKVTQNVT